MENIGKCKHHQGQENASTRRLNFSYTTINNILHDIGAAIRPPGGPNNPWGKKGRPDKRHWS
jgi:hypothetical protein